MDVRAEISKMAPVTTVVAPAGPAAVEQATATLAAGGLVAFPTETVYGLGADATNDSAVARLYAAKRTSTPPAASRSSTHRRCPSQRRSGPVL
jgi:tRNA A37 threonylcarbamoyladenosine synthetase subunit TsaC/SUA5/YrdC